MKGRGCGRRKRIREKKERKSGRGGGRGKGTPAIKTLLVHFCGRWRPQNSDWSIGQKDGFVK